MLQRILRTLKSENFTFAFVEFIMIILGVFIAFQVDEWNDDRKAAIEERIWLQAVREDLDQSVPLLEGRIAFGSNVVAGLDEVLKAIETGEVARGKQRSFEHGLRMRFVTPSPYQLIGTIQQLNISGQMNDIDDPVLRRQLIALVGYAAAYDKTVGGYEGSLRQVLDHSAKFYEMTLDPNRNNAPVFSKINLEAMQKDPQFKLDLIFIRGQHGLILGANQNFVCEVKKVLVTLDEHLDGRPHISAQERAEQEAERPEDNCPR